MLNLFTDRATVAEAAGELAERLPGVPPQLGEEITVEGRGDPLAAAERLDGALLGRGEHGGDGTSGVSRRTGSGHPDLAVAAELTRAPLAHTRSHGTLDHGPIRPRRAHVGG